MADRHYAEVKKKNDGNGDYFVWGVYPMPDSGVLPVYDSDQRKAVDVTGMDPLPKTNDLYDPDTDEFQVSPDPPVYTLDVLVGGNASELIVSPGTSVTIDVTALKDGSQTTDFDGNTHRVPVLNIDGNMAALLTVKIQNGTASATFTPSNAGIFTVDTKKVYPAVSKAKIPNKPLVVAE